MKTFLYIGGFNLNDIALKQFPLRWLNPVALVARAFSRTQIAHTKFFTSKVVAMPGNPDLPARQQFYWRGQGIFPDKDTILGEFRTQFPVTPQKRGTVTSRRSSIPPRAPSSVF